MKEKRVNLTTQYIGFSIGVDRNPEGWKWGFYISIICFSIIVNFGELNQ